MWSTRSELEAALRDAGVGDRAPTFAQLARHCIILVPGSPEEGATVPRGASRLGGEPDLPPDVDWPVRPPVGDEGTFPEHGSRPWPLSFVAQIDFAELAAVHALDGFPRAGRLLLFCDPIDWPWGAREDQDRARAIFTEVPAERLQRGRFPPEFDDPRHGFLKPRDFVFAPLALRPSPCLLPPPLGAPDLIRLAGEEPDAWRIERPARAAYDRFWTDFYWRHAGGDARYEVIHQVGGTAFSIQAPVEAECVKFADDSPRRRSWLQRALNLDEYSKAQRAAHLARAADWQLVLQIDSDPGAGMEWGDAGRLYLCARKQDLAARRFDRCWTLMQCY
jgi:uncharacterized protein YwqG